MANKTQHSDFPINFTGTNVEFTDSLKTYSGKKLRKLLNHFHRIQAVDIEHTLQRAWHSIEVTVHGDGVVLRAQERASDAQGAMDQVLDKIERQMHRYRDRLIERSRQPGETLPAAVTEASAPEEEAAEPEAEPASPGLGAQIVRTKRFALKPMLPEEAAMQMDLLGHDFFVFANADTEQVNVLYRRKDGNYGLIEPEP